LTFDAKITILLIVDILTVLQLVRSILFKFIIMDQNQSDAPKEQQPIVSNTLVEPIVEQTLQMQTQQAVQEVVEHKEPIVVPVEASIPVEVSTPLDTNVPTIVETKTVPPVAPQPTIISPPPSINDAGSLKDNALSVSDKPKGTLIPLLLILLLLGSAFSFVLFFNRRTTEQVVNPISPSPIQNVDITGTEINQGSSSAVVNDASISGKVNTSTTEEFNAPDVSDDLNSLDTDFKGL